MTETYQVSKDEYEFLVAKKKRKDAVREKKKAQLKKYHQSDKGKAAKLEAQRRWRAKKKAAKLKLTEMSA